MNPARWPETVAAEISLIEIALGPEIAEQAFAIVMCIDTFEAACAGLISRRSAATL